MEMDGIHSIVASAAIAFSMAAFIAFLLPTRFKRYCAIAGYAGICVYLFSELPYYFAQQNFFYPTAAVLSVPFVIITASALREGKSAVFRLTTIVAMASLIYAPFGYIPPLGDWLISVVADQTVFLLNLFSCPTVMPAWNIIARNGYQIEIVLACTGIQSIAVMIGVGLAVPSTIKQKVGLLLLVGPTIYILNLFRNAFVIMAYTGQWFTFLPDMGESQYPGYGSFFWAHNVISEGLALVALIGISYVLFLSLPELGRLAEDLYSLYRGAIMRIAGKGN